MQAFLHLCLLLATFTGLASAGPVKAADMNVYNNCSGDASHLLPDDRQSVAYFKPQVHVKPEDVLKNGTGWEEWLYIGHNRLANGSELMYGYKFALGDPTSANYSHTTFIAWAYFPNGSFFRQIDHGPFLIKDNDDGGFTYTIKTNTLTYDLKNDQWITSINSGGYVINTVSQNVEPYIPYGPNYKGEQGQISKGFYSRIETPRAHSDGKMTLPDGLKYDIQSVGTFKHTWGYKVMADSLSAMTRGSTFLPYGPDAPVATLNFYQAWDNAGKEVDTVQYLAQPDGDGEDQVFRIQITDVPESLSIVTTPKPVGLPLSYQTTEITMPLCGPGADCKDKMVWTAHNMHMLFDFVDFSNGHTLYQRVNITAKLWVDGKVKDVAGGIGIVEVYHRA